MVLRLVYPKAVIMVDMEFTQMDKDSEEGDLDE